MRRFLPLATLLLLVLAAADLSAQPSLYKQKKQYGAIPMNGCFHRDEALPSDGFVLNYAVLLSEDSGPRHLISALLHF